MSKKKRKRTYYYDHTPSEYAKATCFGQTIVKTYYDRTPYVTEYAEGKFATYYIKDQIQHIGDMTLYTTGFEYNGQYYCVTSQPRKVHERITNKIADIESQNI